MKRIEMGIVEDEIAQSSAEYILIFGGIIVIVLVAVISYQNYVKGLGGNITNGSEMNGINGNLTQINQTLKS
jgi:hypothetical protein